MLNKTKYISSPTNLHAFSITSKVHRHKISVVQDILCGTRNWLSQADCVSLYLPYVHIWLPISFPCRTYIFIAFEELLLTSEDMLFKLVLVAWSAVCLRSKSVPSCIDLTASLCQLSRLSDSRSKDKARYTPTETTKCFGYKPDLPSCATCNKSVAVPLQGQWSQQWCCLHFESCQRLFCSFIPLPCGISVDSL